MGFLLEQDALFEALVEQPVENAAQISFDAAISGDGDVEAFGLSVVSLYGARPNPRRIHPRATQMTKLTFEMIEYTM